MKKANASKKLPLNIGKANKQKISDRLKERTEFLETVLRPKILRIGMIYKTEDCNNDNWDNTVDIAEKILIKAHAPPIIQKK